MAIIEINRNPSARELRWFGFLFAVFFGVAGGMVWWRWQATTVATAIWCIAAVVLVLYASLPSVRRPLYLAWMFAAFPIGWIVSHTLLASLYFLILTPIGLVMRWRGVDPLERSIDRNRPSYWIPREETVDKSRYFRQF